jgi:hypothetical protein
LKEKEDFPPSVAVVFLDFEFLAFNREKGWNLVGF